MRRKKAKSKLIHIARTLLKTENGTLQNRCSGRSTCFYFRNPISAFLRRLWYAFFNFEDVQPIEILAGRFVYLFFFGILVTLRNSETGILKFENQIANCCLLFPIINPFFSLLCKLVFAIFSCLSVFTYHICMLLSDSVFVIQ